MRSNFYLKPLVIAIATLSVASLASAAGLDRSGQDTTAFFQDGTYAEATYTYIDADVTGKDSSGNKINDIAEDYDFFRYAVKTDVNDTFSVGVLYDEPWGAAADYSGNNDFMGPDNVTSKGVVKTVADTGVKNVTESIGAVKNLLANTTKPVEQGVYQAALDTLNGSLEKFKELQVNPEVTELQKFVYGSQGKLAGLETQIGKLEGAGALSAESAAIAKKLLGKTKEGLNNAGMGAQYAQGVAFQNQNADIEGTNVEVRSNSLSLIGGVKFGDNKEFQVYGGPVAQRIHADVKLRGPAYKAAGGYTAHLPANQDYGYLAGISYSKPEIALKAALTYRSEIDHEMSLAEKLPGAVIRGKNPTASSKFEITTPQSVNLDFQTGVNPTTLATAKVRWVPWSDFAITPTLYNDASKLNLVDYADDQWQVEVGLAKRINPALAISGTVGWDSGAGNPTTSLGPIEGYCSVGAGAKYNIDQNWAISAGGKYLMFGDADGALPDRSVASKFKDNDGFIVGVKLSYQDK